MVATSYVLPETNPEYKHIAGTSVCALKHAFCAKFCNRECTSVAILATVLN